MMLLRKKPSKKPGGQAASLILQAGLILLSLLMAACAQDRSRGLARNLAGTRAANLPKSALEEIDAEAASWTIEEEASEPGLTPALSQARQARLEEPQAEEQLEPQPAPQDFDPEAFNPAFSPEGFDPAAFKALKSAAMAAPLIEIKEKLFIAQTNDVYLNAQDYMGKTIKLEGLFKTQYYEDIDRTYCFVLRNGPGCCGNDGSAGFEVAWKGKPYPQENDWVEAVGVLRSYEEEGFPYIYLALSSLEVKAERGAEFVSQ